MRGPRAHATAQIGLMRQTLRLEPGLARRASRMLGAPEETAAQNITEIGIHPELHQVAVGVHRVDTIDAPQPHRAAGGAIALLPHDGNDLPRRKRRRAFPAPAAAAIDALALVIAARLMREDVILRPGRSRASDEKQRRRGCGLQHPGAQGGGEKNRQMAHQALAITLRRKRPALAALR